jgi:hypothetical protein
MHPMTALNNRLLLINSGLKNQNWDEICRWMTNIGEINSLAALLKAADVYLSGEAKQSKKTYYQYAERALQGEMVSVLLSDVGASRIYLSCSEKSRILKLDYGLSLPTIIKQWKSWIEQEKPTNIYLSN